MRIDQESFDLWNQLKDHGDFKNIEAESGIGRLTIAKAFSEQECSEETFNAITDYYAAKQARINESKSKIVS